MTGAKNGTGTAALVVAMVGLVFCWSVIGGIVCGVVAVILGFLGRGKATSGEANNRGIATAGVALGVVAIVVSAAFTAIWVFAWRDMGGNDYLDCAMRAGNDQKAVQTCIDHWADSVETKYGLSPPSRGSA